MNTVGRCAGDEVDAGLGFEYPQGDIEGQRIARATAIAVRRHDRYLGERCEGLPQAADAFRAEAVVVADQYFQAVRVSGAR